MKRFYGDIAPICINFNHFTNWTKIEKAGTCNSQIFANRILNQIGC